MRISIDFQINIISIIKFSMITCLIASSSSLLAFISSINHETIDLGCQNGSSTCGYIKDNVLICSARCLKAGIAGSSLLLATVVLLVILMMMHEKTAQKGIANSIKGEIDMVVQDK